MSKPLTIEQRKIIEKYKDTDVSAQEIALMAGVYYKTVFVEYREAGGREFYNAEVAQKRIEENLARRALGASLRTRKQELLTLEDRKHIEKYKDTRFSGAEIGEKIGRHKNVVNNEFRNAGGRSLYNAEKAQQQYETLKESRFKKTREISPNEGSFVVSEKPRRQFDQDLGAQFIQELKDREKPAFEDIHSLSHNIDIPRLPLKIWVDRWKEEKSDHRKYWNKEKRYFEFWLKLFGNEIAVDLKPIQIEGAADELLKMTSRHKKLMSDETRRKHLAYLSSLFSTAIYEWKWAIFNPLTCVKMKTDKKKYTTINDFKFEEFDEFRNKFVAAVTEKTAGMTQREAARKAGITLNTFQYSIDPKNNTTIKVFLKICVAFGIKVTLE